MALIPPRTSNISSNRLDLNLKLESGLDTLATVTIEFFFGVIRHTSKVNPQRGRLFSLFFASFLSNLLMRCLDIVYYVLIIGLVGVGKSDGKHLEFDVQFFRQRVRAKCMYALDYICLPIEEFFNFDLF